MGNLFRGIIKERKSGTGIYHDFVLKEQYDDKSNEFVSPENNIADMICKVANYNGIIYSEGDYRRMQLAKSPGNISGEFLFYLCSDALIKQNLGGGKEQLCIKDDCIVCYDEFTIDVDSSHYSDDHFLRSYFTNKDFRNSTHKENRDLHQLYKTDSHFHKLYNEADDYGKKVIKLIFFGDNQIILTGAPGTGKTRFAIELAKTMAKTTEETTAKNYEIIQFHPSYDYTDFIEGLRPVSSGIEQRGNDQNTSASMIHFEKVDGTFKSFCRKIVEENNETENNNETKKKYFFIIDEINRADLSEVFGEVMYCLEKDKRGKPIKTQYSNLKSYSCETNSMYEEDVFEDGFFIPENVVIIGTMNDIDRSVESMDYALRRRFKWVEFKVTRDSLKKAFHNIFDKPIADEDINELAVNVDRMNRLFIENKDYQRLGLNEHFFIGQGYFADVPKNISDIKQLKDHFFEMRIKPTLEDYIRGSSDEKLKKEFLEKCKKEYYGNNE